MTETEVETETRQITSGPGKFELLQSIIQVLDSRSTILHVTFTLGKEKEQRGGRITGIRELDVLGVGLSFQDVVEIEGYLFEGVSPYKHHGTPFTGSYNPTTRTGWLRVAKKK